MFMESLAEAMQKLEEKFFYTVETPCPECGGVMRSWVEQEEESPRCAPVCLSCGYKSLIKQEAQTTEFLYESSLKRKSANYFKYGSLVPDSSLWNSRLNNYKEVDEETLKAKEMAIDACKAIMEGKEIHAMFSGKAGAGKSHLAMAMLHGILKKSNYEKKCLFVSYRELLEQLKFAMNDAEARKAITGTLMKELKLADVVVLDDLGAELGTMHDASNATTYNLDVLTAILDARQNKATIFTTNLTSVSINRVYGERILSRILRNSKGYVVEFKNTSDKRIKPVTK